MSENQTADQVATEKESIIAQIHERVPGKVDIREVNFHFKAVKKEVEQEDGTKKLVTMPKRPTVSLLIPVPSLEGIMEVILAAQDENADEETKARAQKAVDLLQDAVADVVISQARDLVNDDEALGQHNLPVEKLDWNYIANLPKATRRGGGIDSEQWKAFGEDYFTVMAKATDKPKEALEKHVAILLGKFNAVKTQKKVLAFFKDMLTIYTANAENGAEEYSDCVTFLVNKLENLLQADEEALLNNL